MVDEVVYKLLFEFLEWLESGPGMVMVAGQWVNDTVDLLLVIGEVEARGED